MRILFLSHYFPPEVNAPAVRTFEHCREWARCGHEVRVVTCVPNHPQGKVYDGYRRRLAMQHETMEGICVHRIWTYIAANRGFLKRTLGYVSYMMSASLAVLRLPRPDVIVATSPQFFCACAGFLTSKLLRRPWVFELRDIWPASITAVGAIRTCVLIRLLEKVELHLYRDAAAVVAQTESFRDNLVSRGIPGGKIHVVTNGVNPDEWHGERAAEARRRLGLDSRFLVTYVGTHGMAHNLETLLRAADRLRNRPDIHFVTVGDGAERDRLLRMRDEMGLDNTTMVGQVARDQAQAYLEASDACVVILRRTELFRTVIPSKIFEAMAVRKPILLAVDGQARRVVESADAGIFVEPENPDELAEAVLKLKNAPELCERLGENGRRTVEREYTRPVLAVRMLSAIRAAAPGRQDSGTLK